MIDPLPIEMPPKDGTRILLWAEPPSMRSSLAV